MISKPQLSPTEKGRLRESQIDGNEISLLPLPYRVINYFQVLIRKGQTTVANAHRKIKSIIYLREHFLRIAWDFNRITTDLYLSKLAFSIECLNSRTF